jgi:hypothetical protein
LVALAILTFETARAPWFRSAERLVSDEAAADGLGSAGG